ncbi:MAG: glucokinase [Rhizobacter sp.]|nr:glucokinase [Rhizobacter sp.]
MTDAPDRLPPIPSSGMPGAVPSGMPPFGVPTSSGAFGADPYGYPRLLADVGGTNARFAWREHAGSPISDVASYPGDGYASLADAAEAYLRDHAKPAPCWGSIGIANPITGDEVRMTNRDWSFSIRALKARLGMERLIVINDFTALALALPLLSAAELRQVGSGAPLPRAAIALIGPGTGLGVSGMVRSVGDEHWVPLSGEGGHVSLAATTDREASVVAALRKRFGHASAERAVSGPGLENLFHALAEIDGVAVEPLTAAEISKHGVMHDPANQAAVAAAAGSASSGVPGAAPAPVAPEGSAAAPLATSPAVSLLTQARCAEALGLFCAFLGTTAGNLALSLGARGGVYIGGGIVPRLGDWFDRSLFRERFEAKGRFRDYLDAVPTWVVTAKESPALRGADAALVLPMAG